MLLNFKIFQKFMTQIGNPRYKKTSLRSQIELRKFCNQNWNFEEKPEKLDEEYETNNSSIGWGDYRTLSCSLQYYSISMFLFYICGTISRSQCLISFLLVIVLQIKYCVKT